MHRLFERFRTFQEAENNKQSDIEAYKMYGLLVIAKRLSRQKGDILSDIRAIEGVTTVTIDDHRRTDTLDISRLKIKIDITPFVGIDMQHAVTIITKSIKNIKGVQSFKIIARPEPL